MDCSRIQLEAKLKHYAFLSHFYLIQWVGILWRLKKKQNINVT